MKILLAVLFSLFSVTLYAKPPQQDDPEPVFVGYSTGAFTHTEPSEAWVEAVELCRATFGDGAIQATEIHIKDAINSGTFFYPTLVGIAVRSDAVPGDANYWMIGIWYTETFNKVGSFSLSWVAACAQ